MPGESRSESSVNINAALWAAGEMVTSAIRGRVGVMFLVGREEGLVDGRPEGRPLGWDEGMESTVGRTVGGVTEGARVGSIDGRLVGLIVSPAELGF